MGSYWSYYTEESEDPVAHNSTESSDQHGIKRSHSDQVSNDADTEDALLHTPRK